MSSHSAVEEAREAMRLADANPARSVPAAQRALRRAERERDVEAVAVAEQAWGHALMQTGAVDDAIRHLRRSVRYGERAGRPEIVGQSRMKMAFVLAQRGSTRSALREIDAAISVLTGQAGAKARAQRGAILYHIGRLDEAFADYQAAVPALRRAGDRLGVQRTIVNRGLLQAERRDFEAARRDLAEADAIARDLAVGIITGNIGYVAGLRGDVPAALAAFEEAERIIDRQGGQVAAVLQDRAALLLSVGLMTEARHAAERAVEAFRRYGRKLKVPEMQLLLAQVALSERTGRPPPRTPGPRCAHSVVRGGRGGSRCRACLLQATLGAGAPDRVAAGEVDATVAVLAASGRPLAAVQARLDAARLAELRGRPEAAARYLAEAARVRRRGPATLRARGWYAEALARRSAGDVVGALRAARNGLRVLDEHHAAPAASDLRAYSAAHRADLVDVGLRIALTGRPAGVFEWAERGRASRFLVRPVRPPDDPRLAALLPRLRATTAELERARAEGRQTGGLVRRQVELERRIRDRSRLLRVERSDRVPAPVRVRELSAALGDRLLVEYVQVDDRLLALSLVDGRLRRHDLASAAEVAGLLERVPFALRRLAGGTSARASALLRDVAARLDALLLPFPAGRPLVVVPTGVLHSLPWSVLPSCAGRPVAVSPSAALWHRAATRPPSAREVVVAGGPGLPGAREEAEAVAAIHGRAALVDGEATVEAVPAALETAGTAHLAAHGVLAPDNPLFSALLLHDGRLNVHDVQRLKRVPDTVVLAACDVGRSVVVFGDELLGLSATFIERGTARVIASVVPIPDTETKPLMTAVHRHLAAGASPAQALAEAHLEVGPSGFVCIGAG
ncbi:CHAT domain-containing tetratricopeptide repeat protein [Saccharothrix sp.]|uniref:CHAT domain-containing protein n=1 Tax=Saccharothrix sp. TaxID=1873460 RepID=UPI0028110FFA|nr:CHAT domain-containing tetratricopeptide repeat protein [Saccharothrix sp.]